MNIKKRMLQTFILIALIAGCSADGSRKPFTIAGYDCETLVKTELEEPLNEISGLAYDKQRNTFLAVNDEQGVIFVLEPETFRIKSNIHFASKGDYEEIQLADKGNTIYILRSDGTIFKMLYDGSAVSDVKTFGYEGSKAEFESFYIKSSGVELVLIPKNSKKQKADGEVIGYTINCDTGQPLSPEDLKIDGRRLKAAPGIHPSAVAIQPNTKYIYLLASVERILIVLNTSHKIIAEYKLPAALFQQPEGITFDAQNNLYISNESKDALPTIIKIPVQKK